MEQQTAHSTQQAAAVHIIERPYDSQDIRERMDANGYVEGNVAVPLSDIIDNDLEGFLDLLAEKLVDSVCLMDISYRAVGILDPGSDDASVIISVRGDASECIEDDDDDDPRED